MSSTLACVFAPSFYWRLFRVRSWNNGVHCMSFYILNGLATEGARTSAAIILAKLSLNMPVSTPGGQRINTKPANALVVLWFDTESLYEFSFMLRYWSGESYSIASDMNMDYYHYRNLVFTRESYWFLTIRAGTEQVNVDLRVHNVFPSLPPSNSHVQHHDELHSILDERVNTVVASHKFEFHYTEQLLSTGFGCTGKMHFY